MTRNLSAAAFALGAIVVVWMGSAFVDSNLLALTVTVVIGAVFAAGFVELLRYQQATASLSTALGTLPEKVTALDEWLQKLHPSLQNGVRLRIQGEHVGLPAPVLTPYLVGLLVMLGLLGTFVGMVDTLKGAVMALEGTTELEAIRAGLAAPIKGLGMAFGTSVAGVAASAMLGFISTLSRRDRMLASRQLDSKVGTVFQDFSLAYNRQQTYKAMQQQAEVLPEVADKLTVLADKLGRMSDEIGARLIANQNSFHESVQGIYRDLANEVGQSLKESLAESGRLAGDSIQPAVKEIMEGIGREARTTHQKLTETTEQQLDKLSERFAANSEAVSHAWQNGLAAHEQANEALLGKLGSALQGFNQQMADTSKTLLDTIARSGSDWMAQQQASDQTRLEHWASAFEQASTQLQQTTGDLAANTETTSKQLLGEIGELLKTSEALVNARIESEANWLASHDERVAQLGATLKGELESLREVEAQRGEAAVEQLGALQAAVTEHLANLGNALEEPMTRLIETASETPRAAAEIIEKLRAEISANLERDNSLLEERRRIMDELNTLSGSLEQASVGQREAIEKMVDSSASMLQAVGERFTEHVGSEVVKLSEIVDHFSGSAAELSSLGEAFGVAVQLFSDSNQQLLEQLTRIEESLQNSTERSDEQLGYYVAQAREIIDHSVLSQQEIIEQLRQLSRNGEAAEAEVA